MKTKFSEAFGLKYKDKDGKEHPVVMGCYGIGITRLMGTIAEVFHDEKGIAWPQSVAPFSAHLIALEGGEKKAEKVYGELKKKNVEVLYDDRDASAGEKLADADLIGIPLRIVVSKKSVEKKSAEFKKRTEEKTELIKLTELPNHVSGQ